MDQLGHADPNFTLKVYRHGMRRGKDEKDRLRALVNGDTVLPEGGITAENGSRSVETAP